jgi:hypothetical protein
VFENPTATFIQSSYSSGQLGGRAAHSLINSATKSAVS